MPRPTLDVNGTEYQEILRQSELYRLYKSDYPDMKWALEVLDRLVRKPFYDYYTDAEYTDLQRADEIVFRVAAKYSPDQPRDDDGRWTDSGGDSNQSIGHRLRNQNPSPHTPKQPTDLSASPEGVNAIVGHESFRSHTYLDSAGHPTIGYGHKLGPNESYPDGITVAAAQKLLDTDIGQSEAVVRQNVKVPLTQPQFDALTSFVYNVKPAAFRDSTLLHILNQGDYVGASNQFFAWNKITQDGVRIPSGGLTNRRRAERDLFLSGTP